MAGAAWSVPVIAGTVAAPAAAASVSACEAAGPQPTGLFNWALASYPTGPSVPGHGAQTFVLAKDNDYTFVLTLTTVSLLTAETYGHLGFQPFRERLYLLNVTSSDSRIAMARVTDSGYEDAYFRGTVLTDIPPGVTITFTLTVRLHDISTLPTWLGGFGIDAWFIAATRNIDCVNPDELQYYRGGSYQQTTFNTAFENGTAGDPWMLWFQD